MVFSNMRELIRPRHVAADINVRVGRAQPFVGNDFPFAVDLHSSRVQAQVFDVGLSTRRDQQVGRVEFHLRADAVAAGQRDVARPAFDALWSHAEMKADAFLFHLPAHDRGEFRVFTRQILLNHIDHFDSGSEAAERLRQFASDRPRAQHYQARDRFVEREHGFVGQKRRCSQTRQRRNCGARAGRNDEVFCAQIAPVERKSGSIDEAPGAEVDVDAQTAEALRAVVGLYALNHAGDTAHHVPDPHLRRRGRNSEALCVPHGVRDLGRM